MPTKIQNDDYRRSLQVNRSAIDIEARTVEIAFSSEEPYERYFGIEILDHNPNSVKLDRLMSGAAVLVNHDHSDQVGVVESARVDDDRVGRATIRFSKSQRGQEIFQDVQDGIRKLISVGYQINKYEVTEREGAANEVRVTDWEPFELSVVPVPADATVGVGRSIKDEVVEMPEEIKQDKKQEKTFDEAKYKEQLRTEEKKRCDAIRSLADKHDLDELGRQAVDEDWKVEDFKSEVLKKIGERNVKARSKSQHDGDVDLTKKEKLRFSISKLMYAVANPNDRQAQQRAGFELEAGDAAAKEFGSDFNVRGVFVPPSVLGYSRDLTAGGATNGAELVATNLLAGNYIEVLRNASSIMQAGATMLPGLVGNVAIPRQTAGASSTWISTEDGDAAESEASFDQVPLTPKDLACYTEVTRRLFQQSTPAIEGIVMRDLTIAQALGMDLAGLYGTGSGGQPPGVSVQAGINTLDLAAADPTYAEIVEIIKLVVEDNALTGMPRWLIEANGWGALSTTPKQPSGNEGNFILGDNDRIKGYEYVMSNQVRPEEYFFGDFSQVLIGEWGGLEINVDPYTHSLKGKVRYVTFKTADVAVRHPEAFCYAHNGIA